MTAKIASLQCTQCGSTDFTRPDDQGMLRCKHCDSTYRLKSKGKGSLGTQVVIKKGANVKFGKSAKVKIRGELMVEDGANVEIEGEIEIVERSSTERVAAAKEELERLK